MLPHVHRVDLPLYVVAWLSRQAGWQEVGNDSNSLSLSLSIYIYIYIYLFTDTGITYTEYHTINSYYWRNERNMFLTKHNRAQSANQVPKRERGGVLGGMPPAWTGGARTSWRTRFGRPSSRSACARSTVGFHNFNLRIFNLRVSNPNKLIVDVF